MAPYKAERLTKGGRRVLVAIRVSPIRDEQGAVIGAAAAECDITEQRRLEEQAARSKRLAEAGRFAGQIGHDFASLLTPIAGYPDLIKELPPPGHRAAEYCDLIEGAVGQMTVINESLLALGRRGQLELAPADLNPVVREAVADLDTGCGAVPSCSFSPSAFRK